MFQFKVKFFDAVLEFSETKVAAVGAFVGYIQVYVVAEPVDYIWVFVTGLHLLWMYLFFFLCFFLCFKTVFHNEDVFREIVTFHFEI